MMTDLKLFTTDTDLEPVIFWVFHTNSKIMRNFNLIIKLIIFSIVGFISASANAQIENLIVEKYYIADANDATDTTHGRSLEEGMITYRVFLDLKEGSKIIKIYGDEFHPMIIKSTENFYNNIDRPNAYFGYLMTKAWFTGNPTLALDSWLTLGLNTKFHIGIPKEDDTDGSFIGGINNNGGTASIPGGLLVNDDTSAGIPVTVADGYMPFTDTLGQWIDFGFKDFNNEDTTAFGPIRIDSSFFCTDCFLQQNTGVNGLSAAGNKILIAQLTTKGELSFNLNVELEITEGNLTKVVKYVAKGDTLLADEQISPYLQYPPVCGCTDPNYLEFNSSYACNISDSCKTLIVFGCLDPLACNYNPSFTYHIQELCCYIGYCSDRDLSLVCPDLVNLRIGKIELYPNPATDFLNFQVFAGKGNVIKYELFNSLGIVVRHQEFGFATVFFNSKIDISELSSGLYFLKIFTGDHVDMKPFIKN